MKRIMSIVLGAMLIAGTTAVYAGSACGGCSGKKGEKKDKASTNQTEQASTSQKADASA